jgi:hypothetical protein
MQKEKTDLGGPPKTERISMKTSPSSVKGSGKGTNRPVNAEIIAPGLRRPAEDEL